MPARFVTATLLEPLLVVSAVLVALIVWVPAALGGVYAPPLEIVPTVVSPPLIPSTPHVTDVLVVFVSAAENCCV
jgi:hypothetical protein